jgi:hypothetical protein
MAKYLKSINLVKEAVGSKESYLEVMKVMEGFTATVFTMDWLVP